MNVDFKMWDFRKNCFVSSDEGKEEIERSKKWLSNIYCTLLEFQGKPPLFVTNPKMVFASLAGIPIEKINQEREKMNECLNAANLVNIIETEEKMKQEDLMFVTTFEVNCPPINHKTGLIDVNYSLKSVTCWGGKHLIKGKIFDKYAERISKLTESNLYKSIKQKFSKFSYISKAELDQMREEK